MRRQYGSFTARAVMTLLVMTSATGYLLAAQESATSGAIISQPLSLNQQQGVPPAIPDQEQPEVLSRGPVHEAFAEPVNLQLQAGLTVPDRPPPNIEELPPADRPRGEQFVWIPGYWSWDADRNGYIWVSACWRVAPPNMSWVPGYWSQAPGGWEWVAGFWTPAGVQEVEYLPAPPSIGEAEPYGAAPSPDTIWVPPCMYWVQGQYVRRNGYWLAAQPNWVWVPSHYVVTPRGYLFADGHWDYSLERRGMLFAPMYFPPSFYGRVNFTFSPGIVIDMGLLRVSLFTYPRYSHYYFGDYYDDAYLRIGIYPWFDSRRHHTWYDPVYEHDRWRHHRSEPRWEERGRDDYNRRRADIALRPARTYREQESRLAKMPETQRRDYQVTQPIAVAAADRKAPLKFERINTDERQKISRQATALRTFRDERTRWEAKADSPKTVHSPGERKTTVTPPVERRETVQPPQAPGNRKTEPSAQRDHAFVPAREAPVSRPERVKIPAPPVVGKSGVSGIFRKSPPSRPLNEGKDKEGKDLRGNKDKNRSE